MADNDDERKHATEDAPCADPAEPADENSREDDSKPTCVDPPDNSGGGGLADSEPSPMEDGYMAMDDD